MKTVLLQLTQKQADYANEKLKPTGGCHLVGYKGNMFKTGPVTDPNEPQGYECTVDETLYARMRDEFGGNLPPEYLGP